MVTPEITVHTADVVVPVATPPLDAGAVAVADGVIVAVGHLAEVVERHPNARVEHWPGILTPGLVNAHTHLQYTSFHAVGSQVFDDYTAWSVAFVDEYDTRPDEDWVAVARRGVEHMIAAGVTAVGDIVTDFEARDVLLDAGLAGVAYLELIGVGWDEWTSGVGDHLRHAVASAPTSAATHVGISPHAPYSVEEPVLTAMADLARTLDVRLHIHVAESDGEDAFYRTGTGALADRVRVVATRPVAILERGGTGMGAAELCRSLGLLGPTCHIAHGVYLGADGRSIMAKEGTVVTLCPRSNVVVGIDPPPVADFLREDIPIAIGTDSLGSAPSLDPLADVAMLRRLAVDGGYRGADLDERLFAAATLGGARALGLDRHIGSLEVGKRADLAVFDPPGDTPPTSASAVRRLVARGEGTCRATIIAGVRR